MIGGGDRYSTVSRESFAHLELLCEKDDITNYVINKIKDHCMDISAKHGIEISTEFFGRHHAVGLSCSHPLVKAAIQVIQSIGNQPLMEYSSTQITVPLSLGIPTVSLGLTTGVGTGGGKSSRGYINIRPMIKGILQLLILIYLIDKGLCDE
jgi:hypothetical protein